MSTFTVVVDALMAQGKGNLAVRLVREDGEALPSFAAGAHIDVHLPNGLIRQYSIDSAPYLHDYYELCIKKEAQSRGGSSYIHQQLRVGDVLTISAPRNIFQLVPAERYVLVAGGIGITPLLSMAAQLEADKKPFSLYYYVRDRKDAAFIRRIQKGFTYGNVSLYCSNEGNSPRKHLPEDLTNAALSFSKQLYLCGSNGFMQHLKQAAVAAGWDEKIIHQELFAPVPLDTKEDVSAQNCTFEVKLHSTQQIFMVPADKSIAQVLTESGVDIPLSCEMGICGACLTPVMEGVVDHRDSVQSDAEKEGSHQHIALCCSRSCSSTLTLNL